MTEFRIALRRVRMKEGADVSVIRPNTAASITQQMRNMLTDLERGVTQADTAIVVLSNKGEMVHYHWGDYDRSRAAGMLLGAANEMTQTMGRQS